MIAGNCSKGYYLARSAIGNGPARRSMPMTPVRIAILLLWIALFLPAGHAQSMDSCSMFSVDSNAVTRRPYSAVYETEIAVTLPDGKHIVSKDECRLYRDSAGRMRFELLPSIDL